MADMRPTYLEVDLSQLRRNLQSIRAHVAPALVMVMVKANAYGHGVDGVALFIEPYLDYFGVALVEEGIHLRSLGIRKPILVAGGTVPEQIPLFLEHDLTLTGSSTRLLDAAEAVSQAVSGRLRVHLKIDTGMERVGVHEYDARSLIEKAAACSHLDVEGIYTHLANSELEDGTYSALQMQRFREVLELYESAELPVPRLRHVCNSGGVLNLPEAHLDLVRPGILFYGIYPGPEVKRVVEVAPALTWHSKVAYSKRVQPGRPVSYGSLWQSEVETRLVTIPAGYADGYFRRMSNQAKVIVNGRKYPQVGRICMDQFMVNVNGDEAQVGDEVVLLGRFGDMQITTQDLAQWAGTNEYEILTSISARVPRVYVGG